MGRSERAGSGDSSWLAGVLLAAVVTALTSAAVQVAVLAGRLYWERTLIWYSRDFLWMVPAASLVVFLGAAVPIAGAGLVLGRFLRASTVRSLSAQCFAFLGALAVLLLWPRLAQWSQIVLAAGLGVSLGPLVARGSTRRLGTIAATLALLLGATGAGHTLWRGAQAARVRASVPNATAGAPNVLLIILDTVRAASLSLYGYVRPTTPALAQWAAQGVTFNYAFSTSSWTLPSHGSLFTGRSPADLAVNWRTPLDGTFPTIAEVLRDRGYQTIGLVANTYYAGHDSGLNRGFARYDDYPTSFQQLSWSTVLAQTNLSKSLRASRSVRDVARALRRFDLTVPTVLSAPRTTATAVTDRFLAWHAGSTDRPFFAFLNYFDAHDRYYAPDRYRQLFSADSSPETRYDAAIRYLDDEIDRLLSTLRERGVLDRTIVIITSDHGEQFGEHNLRGHGNSLFLPLLHVPLVLRYPGGVPPGVRVDEPVSLADVPATILSLAQIDGADIPGNSFTAAWDTSRSRDERAPAESYLSSFEDAWLPVGQRRTARSVIGRDLHWIRGFDGREALYAYRDDPAERVDRIADAVAVARLDSIRAKFGLSK